MDDLRLQAVAARVVAWHNRHPLARRVRAQQVKSVGYVALSVGDAANAAPPAHEAGTDVPAARWEPAAAALPASAPAEEDFSAAFAALAEHPAADGQPSAAAPAASPATEAHLEAGDDVKVELDAPPEVVVEPDPAAAPATQAAAAAVVAPAHIPTLRDRVLVRAQQPAVQGALLAVHGGYSPTPHPHGLAHAASADLGDGDHFMAPLSPRDLARWVARHGRALLQPPVDGPIRRVTTAVVAGGPVSGTTYVLTASIAGGGLSSRVLVGAGSPGTVLGTRLWSTPRMATAAALAALLLLVVAVAAAIAWRPVAPVAAPASAATGRAPASAASAAEPASAASAAAATAADSVASAASAASAAEAETQTETGGEAAAPARTHEAASAPPVRPELRVTTVRPLPAYAQKGAVGLPLRGLSLSEEDKAAAREAVAAARAGRAAAPAEPAAAQPSAADPNRAASPAPAAPQAAPAAPAPAPAAPAFAISTRSLRTRAEAEQLQAAMASLLRGAGAAGGHVDLLPEGDDWRVVAWPFSGAADADRYRALLAGRGMKVDVVRF